MDKRLIIINRMYAGGYLLEGENIGHEIINLIKTDIGENYIWLNSSGRFDFDTLLSSQENPEYKPYNKKGIKKFLEYDEVYMLMVRQYDTRKWKVLGKAKINIEESKNFCIEKPENLAELPTDKPTDSNSKQKKYIEEHSITYNKKLLNEIFEGNLFRGQDQSNVDLYITFKAENVFLPKETAENFENTIIDITEEKTDKNGKKINGIKKGLANESLRMFLKPDNILNEETYNFFNNIIEGKEYETGKKIEWETANTTKTAGEIEVTDDFASDYFLKVICEEDRELTFSNLLVYFLKNKSILEPFVEKILGIKNFDSTGFEITREEKNIDLFISSPSHQIILENKIHSGLVFEDKDIENKIKNYFNIKDSEELSGVARELYDRISSKEEYSQIDRYYAYAKSQAIEWKKTNHKKTLGDTKGFVIAPLYAKTKIQKELEETVFSEEYSLITYEKLYNFFEKVSNGDYSIELSEKEKYYLHEFLLAMKKHTKEIDNSFEEEMKYKFFKKLI